MGATRICTKCGRVKEIEEFPWKSKLLNRRHAVCKPCTSNRSRNWYENNKASHKENVKAYKQDSRVTARQFVWDYLSSHPCIECGETDPIVLEFDHIMGKDQNVSTLVADGVSIKRLQKEISLCQVLCANCHRRKTAKERGWFRNGS